MTTRRDFLKQSGLVLGSCLASSHFLVRTAMAAGEPTLPGLHPENVLVLLQLAGGNDSLNTVIPYADPLYRQYRPRIALPQDQILELDASTGWHPALAPLRSVFDAGHCAVLHSVGYPQPNRSHFIATDIWQTGSPDEPVGSGWIGRCNDHLPASKDRPFKAIAVGNRLPGALKSRLEPVPSLDSLDDFRFFPHDDAAQRSSDLATFAALHSRPTPALPRASFLQEQTLQAFRSSEDLRRVVGEYRTRVPYPNSGLGRQLRLIAQMIASPLRVRTYHAAIGGFDTHANQLPQHGRLLGEIATAMNAFLQDLDAMGKADRVVVMTYTEFSRRIRENGSAGTDHGAAGAMFLFGRPVKGGIHGQAPSLQPEQLDNGDLAWQTDFRQVYSTILERWLGCPPDRVLDTRHAPLLLIA